MGDSNNMVSTMIISQHQQQHQDKQHISNNIINSSEISNNISNNIINNNKMRNNISNNIINNNKIKLDYRWCPLECHLN